jgi:bla regulator protein blaR1
MIGELTNHLWQSTLFAVAAGLLVVTCRKNRAQVRYWLWFSASLKFLIPLSLLVSFWSQVGSTVKPTRLPTQAVSFTMVQLAQPFPGASFVTSASGPTHFFPIAIFCLWFCGVGAIALLRFTCWLRIRVAVHSSTPFGVPTTVEVRCSPILFEPGVVGFLHPILLLPAGITDRLTKPQFEAVFAHELCHIRRRDNMTAAIHMVVEALFWFFPLVWWIGARMVEERERACDEDVLKSGSEPHVYAQGILKVCENYVESPLPCMSGVTGNNLKKRMERIMRNHVGESLNIWRKLLLGAAGLLAVIVPILLGFSHVAESRAATGGTPPPIHRAPIFDKRTETDSKQEFHYASLKPNMSEGEANLHVDGNSLSGANVRLISYIYFAYNVTGNQFQVLMPQLPKWVIDNRFDIEARTEGNPTLEQMRLMLRHLLEDRFKLAMHYEKRELPVFDLALVNPGKLGPHIQRHVDDSSCAASVANPSAKAATVAEDGFPMVCDSVRGIPSSTGRLRVGGRRVPLELLATTLAQMGNLDRPVVDQTGLSGTFDFTFEWTPQHSGPGTPQANSAHEHGPAFGEDLQQQLGFELKPYAGATVEVLVFDHAEQASVVGVVR